MSKVVVWEGDRDESYIEMMSDVDGVKRKIIENNSEMGEGEDSFEIVDVCEYFCMVVNEELMGEFGVWVFDIEKMLSLGGKVVLDGGEVVDDVWNDWECMSEYYGESLKYMIVCDREWKRFKIVGIDKVVEDGERFKILS